MVEKRVLRCIGLIQRASVRFPSKKSVALILNFGAAKLVLSNGKVEFPKAFSSYGFTTLTGNTFFAFLSLEAVVPRVTNS